MPTSSVLSSSTEGDSSQEGMMMAGTTTKNSDNLTKATTKKKKKKIKPKLKPIDKSPTRGDSSDELGLGFSSFVSLTKSNANNNNFNILQSRPINVECCW